MTHMHKIYRHTRVSLALIVTVLVVALITSACGNEDIASYPQDWSTPMDISGPLKVGSQIAYLNRTMERIDLIHPQGSASAPSLQTTRLETGKKPRQMAASADNESLYVLSEGDRILSVYNLNFTPPTRHDIELDSNYDRITVDPHGEFLLLSFSGQSSADTIAQNVNELGIIDLRGDLPERATFITMPAQARQFIFAPQYQLGGEPQRLVAALSDSQVSIIDLLAEQATDRLRNIPLTISQADQIRKPITAIFDPSVGMISPDTINLYVLSENTSDISQIVIQPAVRADNTRKFDIVINQLAAGNRPQAFTLLNLPDAQPRLLVLDGQRARFTLVDILSGESATFDLPMSTPAQNILTYDILPPNAERTETRVLVYSQQNTLIAVIRPENIALNASAPTAGRAIEAIRLPHPPTDIVMDDTAGTERAIVYHPTNTDGFSILNLASNNVIPIQGRALSDIAIDNQFAYGVLKGTNHLVVVDMQSGHPTTIELDSPGQTMTVDFDNGIILIEHDARWGHFSTLSLDSPSLENSRLYTHLFLDKLLEQELP